MMSRRTFAGSGLPDDAVDHYTDFALRQPVERQRRAARIGQMRGGYRSPVRIESNAAKSGAASESVTPSLVSRLSIRLSRSSMLRVLSSPSRRAISSVIGGHVFVSAGCSAPRARPDREQQIGAGTPQKRHTVTIKRIVVTIA